MDKVTPLTWQNLTEPPRRRERLLKRCRAVAKGSVIRVSMALRKQFAAKSNRILVYHLILPEDRRRFEEHILFLKNHYRLVTANMLYKERCAISSLPLAAITFDDGFRILMADALEILEKHKVKATFFIPTGFVALYRDAKQAGEYSLRAHYYQHPLEPMTPDDLRALKLAGHEIGSHGVSHVRMSTLDRDAAMCDLRDSQSQLSAWLGEPVAGFAYPYGDMSNAFGRPPEWVAGAGYEYGVTLQRGPVTGKSNPMALPREHAEGNWRVEDVAYFLNG